MVRCLSEHVYNDSMLNNKHRIGNKCRKELNFELLQIVSFQIFFILIQFKFFLFEYYAVSSTHFDRFTNKLNHNTCNTT